MPHLREQIDSFNRDRREPSEPEMTQRRLAGLAGVHERTVLRHVYGETEMSLSQAAAYAQALRCSIDELLDGEVAA